MVCAEFARCALPSDGSAPSASNLRCLVERDESVHAYGGDDRLIGAVCRVGAIIQLVAPCYEGCHHFFVPARGKVPVCGSQGDGAHSSAQTFKKVHEFFFRFPLFFETSAMVKRR